MDRREFLGTAAVGLGWAGVSGLAGCASAAAPTAPPAPQLAPRGDEELGRLDGTAQAELVRRGEVQARDLVEAAIRRIEARDPGLNAVVTRAFDRGLAAAEQVDGKAPFAGVPYLLKDLMDWEGVRRTSGSRLRLRSVAQESPPYVDRTQAAGLLLLGKTNTPEFGLLATTEPLALGPCQNPWGPAHSTGGSSGGAAAAVAAGLVPLAQASDGGGSIRIPASCCGVFGLKPSRGRMIPAGPPMPGDIDVHHCVSRSVRDSAALLQWTQRSDVHAPLAPIPLVTGPDKRRLRIAFSTDPGDGSDADPDVRDATLAAASLCAGLGHEVVEARPSIDYASFVDHFLTVWGSGPAQLAAQVRELTGAAPELAGLLEPWTLGLADEFARRPKGSLETAVAYFRVVERSIADFFEDIDVLLTPVLRSAPPALGQQAPDVPYAALRRRTVHYAAYTPVYNAAGAPAMSVPLAWNTDGLPIGAQFGAARGGEAMLLALAFELEAARPWSDRWPVTV